MIMGGCSEKTNNSELRQINMHAHMKKIMHYHINYCNIIPLNEASIITSAPRKDGPKLLP
jgi:hypothetical protein